MKNLKFFLKLILALLPLIAVISYTAFLPYAYMDNEYPAWDYSKDIAYGKLDPFSSKDEAAASLNNDNAIDTVIIGDSRAMAGLNPDCFPGRTVNLAFGGASSIEMYYTLNNYLENNGNVKNVIIMFAPFHYSIIDNFWTRSVYFNYFSINELYEIYNSAHAANSETLLTEGYLNDLLSYRLRMPDKYLPALINARFISRYNDNKTIYSELFTSKGNREFGHDKGNSELCYETSYSEMHKTGDALLLDMYLNRLLKLCSDNDINTVLAVPPMNESSYRCLKESYVEEFDEYMTALQQKYPKIKINGALSYMDDLYYGDSSHLNKEGSLIYSENFVKELNW